MLEAIAIRLEAIRIQSAFYLRLALLQRVLSLSWLFYACSLP